MKSDSIIKAKSEARSFLKEYIEKGDYTYLSKALSLDNTNHLISFHYLHYLKNNNEKQFRDELKKYKFFLDEESCSKLKVQYINHKKDILFFIDSIQQVDVDTNNSFDLQDLKDALEKYYPKEDREIIDQSCEKRVNNLPLNDLEDDILFYLSIKIVFCRHLYTLVNFKIEKEWDMKYLKMGISYIKIFSLILQYYIINNEKTTVLNLINSLDLSNYFTGDVESLQRLKYYIDQIKLDLKEIKVKANYLYTNLIGIQYLKTLNNDKFQSLFFEIMEKILTSNCMKQLVSELKNHNRDNNNLITIDDNYLDYIKKNLLFDQFFDQNTYGATNSLIGKIFINNERRFIPGLTPQELDLYNFCVWVVSGIHEIIGHFLKDYYYLICFAISEESPIKISKTSSEREEGGELVEKLLFKNEPILYLSDVLYILNIKNWNKSINEFSEYFNSNKRKNIINQKKIESIDLFDLNDELIKFLFNFDITKNDLVNFKTDIKMKCKKSNSQPHIDMSGKTCMIKKKRLNKYN